MKTDINTILKKGVKTKIKLIDYSTPKRRKELLAIRQEVERSLKSKEVSQARLAEFIITI